LRIATLAEDAPALLNVTATGAGKVLINIGDNDVIVGYDRSDVLAATALNYFTFLAGTQYVFDVSNGVGFISQNTSLWFSSPIGTSSLEIWIADER
jgi:hypothetical protein|tara:strand:+ start:6841 stop:7128 length:288 start_codon:yes stop_codon:yes gene_type:complete